MTDIKATPATDEQVQVWVALGAEGRLFIPAHVIDSLLARIASDAEIIKALTRERDLAVAHDTQPYPTVWAYEQACKAIRAKDEEIERLRGDNAQWKDLHDKCHPAYEKAAAELATLCDQVRAKDEEIERLKVLCGEHAKASLEWQGLYEVSQAKLIGRIERDTKKHCGCMVGEPCSWTHVKYHHPTVGMAKMEAENATLRAQVETLREAAKVVCDLALPYMQGSPIPRHSDVIKSLESLRSLAAIEKATT